jgi:hypothetical protein
MFVLTKGGIQKERKRERKRKTDRRSKSEHGSRKREDE